MNTREYTRYSQELRDNGYQFITDCPYKGRNVWRKLIPRDDLLMSQIDIEVYEHNDDFGGITYTLRHYGVIERKDCECKIRTEIRYHTSNIIDIESMFVYYADKINNR